METNEWALILGASSGFGGAVALELARAGLNIIGVHMDRRETQPLAEEVKRGIREAGRETLFFNANAADEGKRLEVLGTIAEKFSAQPGCIRVLFHSLAFGALKPLIGEHSVSQRQMEMTADVMGHSLAYWVRDVIAKGLMVPGGRIYAMTSEGSNKAIPEYGPVCAAKAILEVHIRQLAMELASFGITANAILAGVTDTAALRKIPGNERLSTIALQRNPHGRLTTPTDVAKCVKVLMHEDTYWMTGNTIRVDGGKAR